MFLFGKLKYLINFGDDIAAEPRYSPFITRPIFADSPLLLASILLIYLRTFFLDLDFDHPQPFFCALLLADFATRL